MEITNGSPSNCSDKETFTPDNMLLMALGCVMITISWDRPVLSAWFGNHNYSRASRCVKYSGRVLFPVVCMLAAIYKTAIQNERGQELGNWLSNTLISSLLVLHVSCCINRPSKTVGKHILTSLFFYTGYFLFLKENFILLYDGITVSPNSSNDLSYSQILWDKLGPAWSFFLGPLSVFYGWSVMHDILTYVGRMLCIMHYGDDNLRRPLVDDDAQREADLPFPNRNTQQPTEMTSHLKKIAKIKPWDGFYHRLELMEEAQRAVADKFSHYRDVISHELMCQPVFGCDGHVYEAEFIFKWVITKLFPHSPLCPNVMLDKNIGSYLGVENMRQGIQEAVEQEFKQLADPHAIKIQRYARGYTARKAFLGTAPAASEQEACAFITITIVP